MPAFQVTCEYPGCTYNTQIRAADEADAAEALLTKHDLDPAKVVLWKITRCVRSPNINKILRARTRNMTRGAPMGKQNVLRYPDSPVYLQRVHFVDGDYAPDGTYWGYVSRQYLYCAFTPDLDTELYVRATSRREAVKALRDLYPDIKLAQQGGGDSARDRYAVELGVTPEQMDEIVKLMHSRKHPVTVLDKIAAVMGLSVKVQRSKDRKELLRYVDTQSRYQVADDTRTVVEWREKFYITNADAFIAKRKRVFGG